ncbi:MAG: serine/threonine protein phosphatase [Thalassobius sp.]|nr:serine/threonine protein phosphatase [Thalassovita sp.]
MPLTKCLLFILGLFLSVSTCFAQDFNTTNLFPEKPNIPAKIQYISHGTDHLSFNEAKAIPAEQWTKLPDGDILNMGYTKNITWIRVDVKNADPEINNWLFHINYTLLDSLDAYLQKPDRSWKEIHTGRGLPFDTRGEIKSHQFAFRLNLPDNNTYSCFFKVHTKGPLIFPITVKQETTFQQSMMDSHLYYGIYCGALVIMIFYNLFVFITLRDSNYLYYLLSIICTVGIFMTVAGFSFKYLFPESVWWNMYFTRIFMGLVVMATGSFALNFLEIKKYIPWTGYLLKGIMIAAVVAIVLVVTDISPSATNSVVSLQTISLLVTGILAWRKGNRYARFYVFAWTFYLLGGSLITLRNAGILPVNLFTTHGAEIGSAMEVMLLSLALSDRYRIIKQEKEELQEKNLRIQQKHNEELEKKVQERTIKLSEANEELNQINEELNTTLETVQSQKEQISVQHDDIRKQALQLEEAYSSIQSSINYAKRIQEAKLPQISNIKKAFPKSFVFFRPRDHVSGDFYWFAEVKGKKLIAAVDCTGHGVPGAFMSMIGSELLNEVVKQREILQADLILNHLHVGISQTLRQRETANRDGMDMAICIWDEQNNILQYAGAKNPMVYMSEGEIHEVKGDKMPIGGMQNEANRLFTLHEIKIDTPCQIYIYSDGFQDQFGGDEGRKFMSKRFKQLLFKNHTLPMEDQHQILFHTFEEWLENNNHNEPQIDDVLVIGFQVEPVEVMAGE